MATGSARRVDSHMHLSATKVPLIVDAGRSPADRPKEAQGHPWPQVVLANRFARSFNLTRREQSARSRY